MPTEAEIKAEMLEAVRGAEGFSESEAEKEIDEFASREGLDGKSVLQKFYSQWKTGRRGNENKWNSRMAFMLGMTTKKPDGDFVFTKRRAFARPSPPDIDSDFDYNRRQELIDYVVDKYGRYNVGNIGTYGALKMRSALTRIIKALDIANAWRDEKNNADYTPKNVEKVNEILGSLPPQRGAVLKVHDDDGEHIIKNSKDAAKYCRDFKFYMDKYPEILRHASNIEGLLSIFSVHASGVVLSDIPLDQIAPLRTAKDTGGTVALATQFEYNDLETLGLIKFDILAISTLTVIAEAIRLIEENTGVKIDIENLPLDARTSIEAKRTYDLYKTGNLVGVFQCESDGMQDTCREVGVDRFDDIMAVISLYRPGPMDSIPEYCERKKGQRQISYFHPSIEPHVKEVLGPTYGVLVYQEQVMKICSTLGGMTVSEGLVVIKGIGKKKEDIIAKGRNSFIHGASLKGVPKEVAESYWDKFITPFASYGFNAAHSCCYAYNSYITAFLKANYPEEFMVAYLNVETGRRKHDRIAELEREVSKMGIKILPRDINRSGLTYDIIKKKDPSKGIAQSEVRPPIHCKGLPTASAENIVANRPYVGADATEALKNFVEKTDSSLVDSESLIALADAGFFKTKKAKLLEDFTILREDQKRLRKAGKVSQNMFDM
jgi:DNA polymerase-3 subunit alpha